MATVYAVRLVGAHGFERIVVMKRVHPHLVGNREFREMFLDEARLSSLIRHPNIVPVIDVAEQDGELFLIMEYVESVSLAQLLRTLRGDRIEPNLVSRILCDALAGLHAAHDAVDLRGKPMNIIHRDVSPQNIVVGVDGTSRLIDFGIAKASSRLTPTTNGILKGKFGYMAPEQIRQQTLDRRVDVFAAGVVLHETLTSGRLFAGGNEADALLGVLVREIPDPSSIVPGLPPELDAVAHQALERNRDARFSTAGELAAALEAACPPASPRDVAALVERICADILGERRRTLQEAFNHPAVTPPLTMAPPIEVEVSKEPIRSGSSRRRVVVGVAAVAAAALGVIALTFAGEHTQAAVPPAAAMPNVSSDPPRSSESPATPPEPSTSPPSPTPSTPPRPAPHARPAPRPPPRPTSEIHKNNPYLNQGQGP
jgi:serine/threonine protein kinase